MTVDGPRDTSVPPPNGWQSIVALAIVSAVVVTVVLRTGSTDGVDRLVLVLILVLGGVGAVEKIKGGGG